MVVGMLRHVVFERVEVERGLRRGGKRMVIQ